jgi:DNA-binding NtrC family response regulator
MAISTSTRILCVEDDIYVRLIAAEALRDAGFYVIEAENGDEAVHFLAGPEGIDALFTDVRMPGTLDGIDLATQIRRDYPKMPVLVASGYADHVVARLRTLEPPTVFISKPYNLGKMVATLKELTTAH